MHNIGCFRRFCSVFVFSIVLLGAFPNCLLSREGQASDWLVLKKAIDDFIARPSLENSRRFLKAVPARANRAFLGYREEAFRYLCEGRFLIEHGLKGPERYPLFEYELWAGNPHIIRVALRLHQYAEYPYSSKLCASLSALIRIHPRLFLDALNETKRYLDLSKMSALLSCLPVDLFWTTQAQLHELSMRIQALDSVKVDRLASWRDHCLAILKEQIEEIESVPLLIWPLSEPYEEVPAFVKTAFEEFVKCPSMENSRAFRDSIPLDEQKGVTDKIQYLIFFKGGGAKRSYGYSILEREALTGNEYAAEALFRMHNISPGGIDTLELRVSLSMLIRINPRLFLETLNSHKNVLDSEYVEGLVKILPFQFSENSQLAHEYEMRRKALAGVAVPFLRELREFCLDVLNEAIRLRTKGSR